MKGDGSASGAQVADPQFQFLPTGAAALDALETLIKQARKSLCLEMYIYKADEAGARIRAALLAACQRHVFVRVLLDDFGSAELPQDYFSELLELGAQLRTFNPSPLLRLAFRNHRKLAVADHEVAIVGGFNIGNEYAGDGVNEGWRDLGCKVGSVLARRLSVSFDRMFMAARMDTDGLMMFMRGLRLERPPLDRPALLTSGPAFGGASMRQILYADLERAKRVDIIAAYFAPTWGLRRRLLRAANRGVVRLVLPGKSDVPVLRLAGQHLYMRLLRGGVQIFEYQPQVLHAKLLVIDDIVYVGSCNLDTRSLRINFELLIRIPDSAIAAQARQLVEADIARSASIDLGEWHKSSSWWRKVTRNFAFWLAIRFDMILVRRRLRSTR
jgi:cardiolipin synthase